jgi:nitrite reductase/ring-hydroxylating ferredoxin subunit/uncharacterized membrane protein
VGGVEPAPLERLVTRIEDAESLDGTAALGASALRKVLPQQGRLTDLLSGTPFTHPAHPALVLVPIGAWVSATVLDLTGGDARAARRLVAVGNLSAVPAAVTGANDWLTTQGAERRVGLVHATANYAALGLYFASWRARGRKKHLRGTLYALVGGSVLTVGGWLGGHMAYALGVGVDTTAFQGAPEEWTDVAAESEVTAAPKVVSAGGVPVLLMRSGTSITAMYDRCTHRGGPLHEGSVEDGCITCPWHGSQFRLADGAVAKGPATRPQPTFEVRVSDGRVQVRRAEEPRSLRLNPVGS